MFFKSNVSQAALLFAGLMHDVDHPGRNNDFLKNSLNLIAIQYNDQSVSGSSDTDLGELPLPKGVRDHPPRRDEHLPQDAEGRVRVVPQVRHPGHYQHRHDETQSPNVGYHFAHRYRHLHP